MNLAEPTQIQTDRLPIAELRAHLRFGTGFADDAVQDPILERSLRASIAQIETLCAKATLRRGFVWTLHAWRDLGRQVLPRAPLVSVDQLTIVELDGTRNAIAPDVYHVERDAQRPALVARGFVLPQIPVGGTAEIEFRAGFAEEWTGLPADLALATLSLAATKYEDRGALGAISPGVQALLASYRPHRILGGF